MQKYSFNTYLYRWEPDPEGKFYLVSEVDATMKKEIARERQALAPIIEDQDEQIAKLSSDLSANATMLARQCDLAREAERNEMAAIRDLALEVANHEATQRSLFACNSGIMEDEKQIAALKAENSRQAEEIEKLMEAISRYLKTGFDAQLMDVLKEPEVEEDVSA